MDWIEGFNIALEYIEDNLDKNIDYKEISRKACCSLFYFSRIFLFLYEDCNKMETTICLL